MNNLQVISALVIIYVTGFGSVVRCQPIYRINDAKEIDMKLSGTSTLHKWSMSTKTFNSEANFDFKSGDENQLIALKSLTFTLEVTNLKSDEASLDKNAYKALNAEQHKDILYKLLSAKVSTKTQGKYLIKTSGSLSIAGVTKEITMDVYCVLNKDATITCTGSDKLKMTDYNIKPPSFMFGAMKTGDDITLDFTLVYKRGTSI